MERLDGETEAYTVSAVAAALGRAISKVDSGLTHCRTEKQVQTQSVLPVTLIPIRIDMDIQPFRPEAPLPTPSNAREFGINENLPAYRLPDVTPAYRLKDSFLWNLHEALTTPDQFAKQFVDELDLPTDRKPQIISQIASQIRQQLEEYAGVALHPLFHSTAAPAVQETGAQTARPETSRDGTSTPAVRTSTPAIPATNGVSTPITNGASRAEGAQAPAPTSIPKGISATATALPSEELHNPDDTYRCIVTLNINLMNRLYTDKFEWSLLHPPGFAEMFAKTTCADIGLSGEWVNAMTHSIYEAVLRLKKEACENGGLVGDGEIDNDAVEPAIGAGWRYDQEHLCDEWEPKVEILSPEEIEKREGDRERQIRRLRRETARFSSTANMTGTPANDFFSNVEGQENMGRGERSKKKRRFRSLSPVGRGTPGAGSGYGGQDGGLQEGYVEKLSLAVLTLLLKALSNDATGNDKHGGAHTAGSGVRPSGLSAMDRRDRELSATTVDTSTNATRSCRRGVRISSTMSGRKVRCRFTDRSGERMTRPYTRPKVFCWWYHCDCNLARWFRLNRRGLVCPFCSISQRGVAG
jgi:chromatin structure-remodeling complex subunit SFH1